MSKEVKKERKWLSKKEVCQYLRISMRTLENYRSAGYILAYRLGGKVYYDQFEIDQAIVGNTSGFSDRN